MSLSLALPDRIEAGSVVLERLDPRHAEGLAAAVAQSRDELVLWMPWYGDDSEDPRSQRERIVALQPLWENGVQWDFALVPASSDSAPGEVWGAMSLMTRRAEARAVELGYWVRSDRTRQGIGRAAATALTRAAFANTGIDRVEVYVDQANAASLSLAARVGFRRQRSVSRPPVAQAETGVHDHHVVDRESLAQPSRPR